MGRNSEEKFSFVVWEDEMCRGLDKMAPTERNNWRCDLPKPRQEKEDASYRTSVSKYILLELKIPKLQAIRIQCYQNHIVPTLYIYTNTHVLFLHYWVATQEVKWYVEKQVTHCFPMFCCRWYKCCPVYFCNTCQQDFHILSLVLFTMCYLSMLFKNLNVP